MGRDKAAILVGDKPLIRHTYDTARKIFRDIVIVSSIHEVIDNIEAPILPDVIPVRGSLTGIATALLHASTPYVFILACDMPFINEEAIRFMISQWEGEDVVVPVVEKGFEQLHAIYSRSCLSPMLTAILRGRMQIKALYPLFSVK